MAFTHGTNATLTINSVVLAGFFNDLSFERTVDTAETTVFGNAAKNYIPGLTDATLSVSGFYDKTATTGVVYALEAILSGGVAVTAVVRPAGASTGNYAYTVSVILTGYTLASTVGDAVTVSADFQCTGAVTPAVL